MKRKILAAILACAMLLAVAVPALAATDPLNPTLKVTGTTNLPTINLQMPTEPSVILNPYGLSVTIGKDKKTAEIVSPVMSVVNLSDCPIQVGVKANVAVAGTLTLAADNTGFATATAPTAVLKLEGKIADKAGEALTSPVSVTIAAATTDTDLSADFKGDGTSSAKATNTMAAATAGKVATTGGVFSFQFTGEAATNSKITWTAKDTVTPTLTFKFIPLADMPTT